MIMSAKEFVELRTSDDPNLYRRAAHDSASDEVWLDVIEKFPHMKTWVAHNKTISLSVLGLLAYDPDPKVRYAVAQKRKLSLELFQLLANDPDESVRRRIVLNKKTPQSVLQSMSSDSNVDISRIAQERLANAG